MAGRRNAREHRPGQNCGETAKIIFMPTKVREAIRIIQQDGWYEIPATGTSHRQFKHPTKAGRVTVAGKLSDDLAPKTFDSILRQAGLK